MPKGIRKACANCIKARLACDEGRPCQRCIVHACECIAVPRKPRVKKQKLDLEPPSATIEKQKDIPVIDSNADVVVTNWSQGDFKQSAYSSFQLDRTVQEEPSFDGCSPNLLLTSASLSPLFMDTNNLFQFSPHGMGQMPSPPSAQVPSPPQPLSPPSSSWAQVPQVRLQNTAIVPQAYITPTTSPNQQTPLRQSLNQDIKPIQLLKSVYEGSQMLSLLLDEKPSTLLGEWNDSLNFLPNMMGDGQQVFGTNYYDATSFKKLFATPTSLPQPMNATPLFPAPIAVFDKQKFQLLDANEAMARFVGHANVAGFATTVTCMDDLIDPAGAQIAKNADTHFVAAPAPCYRLGEIRTLGGLSKTVEFHVDLTEQLLILTIKNVFDTVARGLLEVQHPVPIKSDVSSQLYRSTSEYLAPTIE